MKIMFNSDRFEDVQKLADAIVNTQRNVQPFLLAFNGNRTQSLPYPAGTMGEITYIGDHGGGIVRISIDGNNPVNDTFPEFNARHTLNIKNVDLSLVRLRGTSRNSDYTIAGHIYP